MSNQLIKSYPNFNPRPHAGDDYTDAVIVGKVIVFQPTSPRGGRPGIYLGNACPQRFQPTSPRGGRRSSLRWGCTTADFNPRPHAGDDVCEPQNAQRWRNFNPRPHAGDDSLSLACLVPGLRFQPTSPRGGRRRHSTTAVWCGYFNPRPHAGDD